MKRWFYLIMLITVIIVGTVACGGDSTAETGDTSQDQPVATGEMAEEATLPPPVIPGEPTAA